ncbi:MAG TPA: helix-turn-helix transcriptional regulator [Streptosporangiaceae bacterium]|nr:helix-turn-helix transcriptional regulator [Streptosporangiaceae bacterium]
MAGRTREPGPISIRTAENLRRIRLERGLSYAELARRLARIGHPILDTGLLKIEKGDRRVDVDDLVALALALGVTPNRLMLPDVDLPGAPAEAGLTEIVKGRPSWLWEWAQGERHPPIPFENSHSWFGGGHNPDITFAIENRPYLTGRAARAEIVTESVTTPEIDIGLRELILAVTSVMATGLRKGRHFDSLAFQVRRLVELLLTFTERPAEELSDALQTESREVEEKSE